MPSCVVTRTVDFWLVSASIDAVTVVASDRVVETRGDVLTSSVLVWATVVSSVTEVLATILVVA